jgi:hypothetical protein
MLPPLSMVLGLNAADLPSVIMPSSVHFFLPRVGYRIAGTTPRV